MQIVDEAVMMADTLGVEAITRLQERILAALEAGEDAEAVRLDELLMQVEVSLSVEVYPEVVSPVCQSSFS